MSSVSRNSLDFLVSRLILYKKAVDEYALLGSAREIQPVNEQGDRQLDGARGFA